MLRIGVRLASLVVMVVLLLGVLHALASGTWTDVSPERLRSVRVGQGSCSPNPQQQTCCIFAVSVSCKDQMICPTTVLTCPGPPTTVLGTCGGNPGNGAGPPSCMMQPGSSAQCAFAIILIKVDSCALTGMKVACPGGQMCQFNFLDPTKSGQTAQVCNCNPGANACAGKYQPASPCPMN